MNRLMIQNALIITMADEREPFTGYVEVEHGTIKAVGEGQPPSRAETLDDVLDAGGRVLLPGLVNAHTHLYQVLLRAVWENLELMPWLERIYGCARVLKPDHFYRGSLLGCMEAIRSGVTTICEHNFLNPGPESAVETLRAIDESGLRAVFARTIMDTGEMVPECTREQPETAFRRIDEILSAHQSLERISFMTGPNTPPINTSLALLKEIRRFADEKSIGISAHVAESQSVVDYTRERYGKAGVVRYLSDFDIPRANSIFAHCVHVDSQEVEILRATGASVSHNPVSNMMLGDGVAPVVEMLRCGVNVALGTDGAASNHSQDLFDTMKAASLLQKVHHRVAGIIKPYEVLRMATLGGARALGLQATCGSIEVGKRADLMILDLDTLHSQPVNDFFSQIVHCAKASDVRTVIVDGAILMRERRLTGFDEKEILAGAQQAHRDLKQRVAQLSF